MNQGWIYTDRVSPTAVGQTVLDYYTQRYPHSSQADWHNRIVQGQVLLDRQPIAPNTPLKSGQVLTYHRAPWQEPAVPLDFGVLYEDADLWVIAKPSGLPVLPGGRFLEHTLLHQMRSRYSSSPLGQTPTPLHRLGRGTSGVILIAKSQAAKTSLSQQFRNRKLIKIYRALIGPTTPSQLANSFTCHYPIGKTPYPRIGYKYDHTPDQPGSMPSSMTARSDCQVLERTAEATLVEVSILTGRPHQIRIHLAAAGHPLLGDPLYTIGGIPHASSTAIPSDCGYHLHSHRLQFTHPRTGKPISITATPPQILQSTSELNQRPQAPH